MNRACGRMSRTAWSQIPTSSTQPSPPPLDVRMPAVGLLGDREFETRVVAEGPTSRLTVGDAVVPLPPVGEDRIHVVLADDLARHLGDELAVVRRERTRQPDIRMRPVLERVAVDVASQPFGVRGRGVGVDRVRVDARHHAHAKAAGALDEGAERVGVAEVPAAVVVLELCRVVGDVTAGADTGRVRLAVPHQVEPEVCVEVLRIVLGQGDLSPPSSRQRPVSIPSPEEAPRIHGSRSRCRRPVGGRGSSCGIRWADLGRLGWGDCRLLLGVGVHRASGVGRVVRLLDKFARIARASVSLFHMEYREHRLSVNVSMLFTELPYSERYAAAAQAGFTVVESWWPFAVPDPSPAEIDDFVRPSSRLRSSSGR